MLLPILSGVGVGGRARYFRSATASRASAATLSGSLREDEGGSRNWAREKSMDWVEGGEQELGGGMK